MKTEDKKDVYKFIIVLIGIAGFIGSEYLPILIVDPKLLYLITIGAFLGYRYMKPIIMRHTGLTEEELEEVEEDLGELAGTSMINPEPEEPVVMSPG